MKKHMLALFLACSMLCTLGACGQQEESSAVGEGNSSLTDSADDSAADSRPADSAAPDNSSKGEESTGRNEQNPESAADTSGSGTDSAAEPSGNTGKPSSGGNDAPGSQGNTSDSGQHTASTTAPRQEQTPSVTTVQAETTPASEIKTITLLGDSVRFEGTGIAARGSRVGITKGGTYRISGSLSDGQIEINTEKKVVLQFDGMSITNSAGSAINVINAKRVTVELMPGTVNSLEDGNVQHDADRGALFTNDTLEIGGSGTLNVKSNYAHGIISDDDIIVNGGTIRIVSTKSGLFANDDISADIKQNAFQTGLVALLTHAAAVQLSMAIQRGDNDYIGVGFDGGVDIFLLRYHYAQVYAIEPGSGKRVIEDFVSNRMDVSTDDTHD